LKVLVTGCAGFIGSNLCEFLLAKKIPVVGIDNFTPNYSVALKKGNVGRLDMSGLFEFIEGDINDDSLYEKLPAKKIAHVAHLAARVGVRDSKQYPDEYFQTNVIGSLKVLKFAHMAKAKKVVMASTSSAYGKNPLPFVETQPTSSPLSFYAASKIGMESLAFTFHETYGTPINILRFFTVYGPGGRPDMAIYTFAERISAGEPLEVFGDGNAKRDFTYVGDTVAGIWAALNSKTGFGTFNIGNSDARTVNEMIALLEKNLGKKAKVKYSKAKKEDVAATLADISKAKKELGFSPKVRLEEGIEKFTQWYLAHKSGTDF